MLEFFPPAGRVLQHVQSLHGRVQIGHEDPRSADEGVIPVQGDTVVAAAESAVREAQPRILPPHTDTEAASIRATAEGTGNECMYPILHCRHTGETSHLGCCLIYNNKSGPEASAEKKKKIM